MKKTDTLHIKIAEGFRGRLRAVAEAEERTLSAQAYAMLKEKLAEWEAENSDDVKAPNGEIGVNLGVFGDELADDDEFGR